MVYMPSLIAWGDLKRTVSTLLFSQVCTARTYRVKLHPDAPTQKTKSFEFMMQIMTY